MPTLSPYETLGWPSLDHFPATLVPAESTTLLGDNSDDTYLEFYPDTPDGGAAGGWAKAASDSSFAGLSQVPTRMKVLLRATANPPLNGQPDPAVGVWLRGWINETDDRIWHPFGEVALTGSVYGGAAWIETGWVDVADIGNTAAELAFMLASPDRPWGVTLVNATGRHNEYQVPDFYVYEMAVVAETQQRGRPPLRVVQRGSDGLGFTGGRRVVGAKTVQASNRAFGIR